MRKTEIKYRVPYADTDQMGVVYYANFLVYFERLRNELLRDDGLPYYEIEKLGIMLPVIEAVCKYRNPARYDDMLTFSGWVDEIKGVKIKICCEVRKDMELLAEGYTVHACVDIKTRRPTRPPECLTALVGGKLKLAAKEPQLLNNRTDEHSNQEYRSIRIQERGKCSQ